MRTACSLSLLLLSLYNKHSHTRIQSHNSDLGRTETINCTHILPIMHLAYTHANTGNYNFGSVTRKRKWQTATVTRLFTLLSFSPEGFCFVNAPPLKILWRQMDMGCGKEKKRTRKSNWNGLELELAISYSLPPPLSLSSPFMSLWDHVSLLF